MTKNLDEIDIKVEEWMTGMGFQSNLDAEIPNYIFSLGEYINPSELTKDVANHYKNWDPVEDITMISQEVARLMYLGALDMFNDIIEKIKEGVI